jgi:superfamily II DNA or RNA helicase
MSFEYLFHPAIKLFVENRISKSDAERQERTVEAILDRLHNQPGLILADEVGMGKTFVALGVAVSVFLKEKRPAVIMIPPNLIDKWPNDFRLFCEACVRDKNIRKQLRCGLATRPEEFLKLLDDDESRRCAVIFLTHGALTRNMGDGWIKLAIIQRTLYRRKETEDLYRSLSRYAGALIEKQSVENKMRYEKNEESIWIQLLNAPTSKWKKILVKKGVFDQDSDDPIPAVFQKRLDGIDRQSLDDLYGALVSGLPRRETSRLQEYLRVLRAALTEQAKMIWSKCLSGIKLELPLLVFDEAHHLKNSQTQLVTRLFKDAVAEEEAGILAKQFDRMLFLTATPFQLGHLELYNVLERFNTINWESSYKPDITSQEYKEELTLLLKQLDHSQIAARKLDISWGKLNNEDLVINGNKYDHVFEWWMAISDTDKEQLPEKIQKVYNDYIFARQKLSEVENGLRKYVIRHLKPRVMAEPYAGVMRRKNLPGGLIIDESINANGRPPGIEINKESMLPFLLAARLSSIQSDKRPVFAEGLASSFEAFRYTRSERLKNERQHLTDTDDDPVTIESESDPVTSWYLDQLDESLQYATTSVTLHPKLKPTVDKAIELWQKGEKVLIFCHYIATAKALRLYISRAMRVHIRKEGALKFNCPEELVFEELEKVGHRITAPEGRLYKVAFAIINNLINKYPDLDPLRLNITEAIIRYLRTPSFLVRFATETENYDEEWLHSSFETKDMSKVTLSEMLDRFLKFLNDRPEICESYIDALMSIQSGGIRISDITIDGENEEMFEENENTVMANVALCYGNTKPERRRKLMNTFNTPFFPDILVTSSVMAEGVDLHLNCRHIIHHDLAWNPSTLEQRTGRVDRIGSKAERCGEPIYVYLPYLSETQDEKMYRVVMERERWFNIVMGEKYKVDASTTDKYAERIPLPEELANELAFKLEV